MVRPSSSNSLLHEIYLFQAELIPSLYRGDEIWLPHQWYLFFCFWLAEAQDVQTYNSLVEVGLIWSGGLGAACNHALRGKLIKMDKTATYSHQIDNCDQNSGKLFSF